MIDHGQVENYLVADQLVRNSSVSAGEPDTTGYTFHRSTSVDQAPMQARTWECDSDGRVWRGDATIGRWVGHPAMTVGEWLGVHRTEVEGFSPQRLEVVANLCSVIFDQRGAAHG